VHRSVKIGVLIALVLLTVGALLWHPCAPSRHPTTSPRFDHAAAARAAQMACADLQQLQGAINRNASANKVFALSLAMVDRSRQAQILDPRWIQLESAALELDDSLHHDSGIEAGQAISLLRAQCAPLSAGR
jgi:hypothetical protein